jgi:UDP-glucuronate 4-epimerase
MSYNSGAGARRALVTGCAGFIGSHLSERLVADGCEVVGVDAFTPFYDRESKNANLERLHQEPGFELREVDLATDDLDGLADGVDVIFHLAGEPGVRQSFGPGAGAYVRNNIEATTRLVSEVAREPDRPFVFASSSTVYGDALSFPTPEASPLRPISPYGRTKAAAEEIVALAHERSGLAAVGLRYFSAYGPRQRPDMAFRRFIEAALDGRSVPVYGTGEQRRDFTYVDDIVEATVSAAQWGRPGHLYNVGGGSPASVLETLGLLQELLESPVAIELQPKSPGDAMETCADTYLAQVDLGFSPMVRLTEGLAREVEWVAQVRSRALSRVT